VNNESDDFWWKVAAVVVGAVVGVIVVWYFLGPSDNGDPKVTAKTQPTVDNLAKSNDVSAKLTVSKSSGESKVVTKTQPTVAAKTYNTANLTKYKGNAYYAQHGVSQNSNNAPVLIAVTQMDQNTFINYIIGFTDKVPGFKTIFGNNTAVVNAVNMLVDESAKTPKDIAIPLVAHNLEQADVLN